MSKNAPSGMKNNPFKQADKAAHPTGSTPNFVASKRPGAGGTGAASAKEVMLHWCQVMTKGYPHVEVKNFGSSWADGMAFCALIHHFYPDAFDFSTLKPENRKANFELAFKTAEELGNVAPILDTDDMLRMKVPDWKCVFTQIQLYYRRFQLEQGRGANKVPVGLHPPACPTESKDAST